MHVKVLQKGKITIPKQIRESVGIKEGDMLTLEAASGKILSLPQSLCLTPPRP
ncbi:MAG: AbrB/MazE/SpoVT family DNA-binding domain-containing protein [Thaumarchaeota archaeon]|nr:AbrB/MazE/SpoVT family DNA-binding domain-containing protein [Nitrososphaerota archaeon]